MKQPQNYCVIFDLDGTLIDSEPLCNQAFLDLLPNLDDTVETLVERYRGLKLAHILADLERRIGQQLPDNFETRYRQQVATRFATDLKVMPNVHSMLAALDCSYCIASSGPQAKIRQGLSITGLTDYFGERIFSSYDVGSWKPNPGLFLHTAAMMGFEPVQCIVVEDSQPGIEASLAAGMKALYYNPHLTGLDCRPQVTTFRDMAQLPRLLDNTFGE